jgi:hypothetical protein
MFSQQMRVNYPDVMIFIRRQIEYGHQKVSQDRDMLRVEYVFEYNVEPW